MLGTEREVLHRLLTHYHPHDFEEFFKFFEEPERIQLSKMKVETSPLDLKFDDRFLIFERIHYSWFLDILKKLPQRIVDNCHSIFSDQQIKGLSKLNCFKTPHKIKDPHLTIFYRDYFLNAIGHTTLPPISILPLTSSIRFLNFSKKRLVKIILHLGILELANLSKKIVDQKVLSQIETLLTQPEKKIFQMGKKTTEPRASTLRDFDQYLKNKKTFTHFLEIKGIERFAMGIVLDHPYFVWHIAHILDRGRGQELLIRARRYLPNPYTPFFNKQLMEISDAVRGP